MGGVAVGQAQRVGAGPPFHEGAIGCVVVDIVQSFQAIGIAGIAVQAHADEYAGLPILRQPRLQSHGRQAGARVTKKLPDS